MGKVSASKVKGRKGKIGKKKGWIAVYFASGKPLFNKARRLTKHIKRYGDNDESANEAFKIALAGMPRTLSKAFK